MPSPFPGMDPYLEGYLWPDVHHRLATQISRQLAPKIQPNYVARLEISVIEDESFTAEVGLMDPDVEVLKIKSSPPSPPPPSSGTIMAEAVVPLAAPLTMIFEAGRAAQIEGGPEADRLAQLLAQFNDPAVYNFAAWGMGTNPGARLLGDEPSFEGERIYGWAHVSLGSNAALPGGTVRVPIHLDAIIAFPVVELDGRVVMSKGAFHLE